VWAYIEDISNPTVVSIIVENPADRWPRYGSWRRDDKYPIEWIYFRVIRIGGLERASVGQLFYGNVLFAETDVRLFPVKVLVLLSK
jgi:hypothetical protein